MSDSIPELEIFGIYSRGVPNAEKIILRSNGPVNLSNYALILGHEAIENTVFPLADHFLWLGPSRLMVPSWVFVFTGQGETSTSQEMHTKDPCQNLYWNKENVILTNPKILPTLIYLGSVEIGRKSETPVTQLDDKRRDEFTKQLLQSLAQIADQSKKG